MTGEELRQLVQSDAAALAMADARDWVACAARCRAIAPRIVVPHLVAELGILSAYANPTDAVTVLAVIDQVAQANPVVAVAQKWIQPGAPGIDVGDQRTRAMLTAPIQSGGLGLSSDLARPLLALAERSPDITARQLQAAFGRDVSVFAVDDLVRVRPPFNAEFPGEYKIDYIMPDGTCFIAGDRSFAPEHLEAVA